MDDDAYYLNREDLVKFRTLWKAHKGKGPVRPRSDDRRRDPYQPPEVYLARTPSGGIPSNNSSGTGTASDDAPGCAQCRIYRIVEASGTASGDDSVQAIPGLEKTVYNFSGADILEEQWVLIVRDKFGQWYVPPNPPDVSVLHQCTNYDDLPTYPNLSAVISYSGSTRMEVANVQVNLHQDYLTKCYVVMGEVTAQIVPDSSADTLSFGDKIVLYLGLWYGEYDGSGTPAATSEPEWIEKIIGVYDSTFNTDTLQLGAYLFSGSIMTAFSQDMPVWSPDRDVAPEEGRYTGSNVTLVRMRVRAERLASTGRVYNLICGGGTTAAGTYLKSPDLKVFQMNKFSLSAESPGPAVAAVIDDPTP
ncbi:MAG: hypothetical protein E6R03_04710 [Hyphomicrobiaceae bacterium]|nr:MAG: hypothetical protein E6R03_04710 [Hyphomicrobiaceae bacterium]